MTELRLEMRFAVQSSLNGLCPSSSYPSGGRSLVTDERLSSSMLEYF